MTDSLLNRAPLLVQGDIDDQLATLLSRSSLLAWDIETSGLDWQQDRIGTCQLHSDADVSVIVQPGSTVEVASFGMS
jgi:ribonuclease D